LKKIHIGTILPFIVFCILIASGCSKSSDKNELRVGLLAISSGELFRHGLYVSRGATLAADEINSRGGIKIGKRQVKIKIFHANSGNNKAITTKAVKELIDSDKVHAVIGPVGSSAAIFAASICNAKKIPLISPSAGTSKLTPLKYAFRVSYTSRIQSKILSQFAATVLGKEPVAVLYAKNSDYSSEMANFFCSEYRKSGGIITAQLSYNSDDREFSPQMKKIIESGAGILFMPSNTKEVQIQAAQARMSGYKGVFLGSDSWDPVDLVRNPVFMGSYFTDHWRPGLKIKKSVEFEKAFYAKNSCEPTELEALSYDAMMSLCAAVEYCGSTKGKAIRKALSEMPVYSGVTGKFSYNDHGDPNKDVLISEIMPDGSIESRFIPSR
jgi:branched-chain amino acid transport system substrate-binding protein